MSASRTGAGAPGGRRYHHGDLKAALVEAGLELARAGGPDALTLREVTRAVGVTPNAAYRHFADHETLVLAVATRAQDVLAGAMATRISAAGQDPVARLRGVGLGYIDFARAEPGLFHLAFRSHHQLVREPERDDPAPFRLLNDALDGLVEAELLSPTRREHAEWACWSAVHGIADLATRGPLHDADPAIVDSLAELVVDRIIDGVRA
ncbi:TetR/AcrR family transcriptional regulator [Nocardioides rotundus]|uniref:TetR/AcrR family transcriptional regulator n=1 Tax=Nocardioides rotundus TaxID=1774216 RepID=UPI001CBDD1AE|nr:TetR/AcrR family transcriptional regulator [Nocardioides rotundus]UAL29836.1 TetR/AcrR family transcriptional regulator [Nocardioides rotundus]